MNQMLRQVTIMGTGTRARVPGYDMAGKTGTTSDYKDAWFVGYTGGFVAAVWVGKDNNNAMRGVTGGQDPAEIWHDFMAATLPRLNAMPIPGGPAPEPVADLPATPDPIGDLLNQTGPTPAPPAPAPGPPAPIGPVQPAAPAPGAAKSGIPF
jgi:penicillin-binding protein 1A